MERRDTLTDRKVQRQRTVVLGDHTSIFTRKIAHYWQQQGLDVSIVTHNEVPSHALTPEGVPIISGRKNFLVRPYFKKLRQRLHPGGATKPAGKQQRGNAVLSAPTPYWYSILSGITVAQTVRALRPDFVFGQEVYAYGPATAMCWGYPRVLFPWGYDIRDYAHSSSGAFQMVKNSLQRVELIVPTASEAAEYICKTFGIPQEKVVSISWGVDRTQFHPAKPKQRREIFQKYALPADARVVMNVRRCHPDWGCHVAFDAFVHLAAEHPNLHFVALGGLGDHVTPLVGAMREQLAAQGLSDRFTLFDHDLALHDVAELMSVSDVFVSLPRFVDMRSSSILQAAACGGAPVISDQEEARRMVADGFRAQLVDPQDRDAVAGAITHFLRNKVKHEAAVAANDLYLERFEDWERNMEKLLEIIHTVSVSYAKRNDQHG